jgi:hypothetical protein
MSFELSGVDPLRAARIEPRRPGGVTPGRTPGFADALASQPAARSDAIPASPPPELRSEMLAAQRAFDELYARGRQLHFEMQDGRVKIQLQDLKGNVVKEIPPSGIFDIASRVAR